MGLSDNAGRIMAVLVQAECGSPPPSVNTMDILNKKHGLAALAVELAEALEKPLLFAYARAHANQPFPADGYSLPQHPKEK